MKHSRTESHGKLSFDQSPRAQAAKTSRDKGPLIAKADYTENPEIFRLETGGLPEEAQVGFDVMHTTGTSGGKPTPFYTTVHDFYRILTANRRALEIRGVRETDLVANLSAVSNSPAAKATAAPCAIVGAIASDSCSSVRSSATRSNKSSASRSSPATSSMWARVSITAARSI